MPHVSVLIVPIPAATCPDRHHGAPLLPALGGDPGLQKEHAMAGYRDYDTDPQTGLGGTRGNQLYHRVAPDHFNLLKIEKFGMTSQATWCKGQPWPTESIKTQSLLPH